MDYCLLLGICPLLGVSVSGESTVVNVLRYLHDSVMTVAYYVPALIMHVDI